MVSKDLLSVCHIQVAYKALEGHEQHVSRQLPQCDRPYAFGLVSLRAVSSAKTT
jgi:hypothetical protein